MKTKLLVVILVLAVNLHAQQESTSPLNALNYGVILDNPATKTVKSQLDVVYLHDDKGSLKMDIYFPPNLASNEKRPAIIFLNAIGEVEGQREVKSWGIYTSWPRLMAANGYIGISMETDGSRIEESIQALFNYIGEKGGSYHIDKDRLGVYAASANVTRSANYLMSSKAFPGIKAAVLYYGSPIAGPYRKDLPVLFVIAEGDTRRNTGYQTLWGEVMKNNAPWTVKMGTGMPHAFDAYSDNDSARKIIIETISFWQANLDPVPIPSWKPSKGRDVFGNIQMNHPKALELLASLSKEYPNDNRTQLFYAEALREGGQDDKAETIYQTVLTREPENVEVLIDMAKLKYASDKPTEAKQYVDKAVSTGKMNRNSYTTLAFGLLVAGKDRDAATYYEKALELEQNGIDYYNLGCAYAKYDDKDNAFKALNNAVRQGYKSKQQYENDPDLKLLRGDKRYEELVSKLQ